MSTRTQADKQTLARTDQRTWGGSARYLGGIPRESLRRRGFVGDSEGAGPSGRLRGLPPHFSFDAGLQLPLFDAWLTPEDFATLTAQRAVRVP